MPLRSLFLAGWRTRIHGTATLTNTNVYSNKRLCARLSALNFIHRPVEMLTLLYALSGVCEFPANQPRGMFHRPSMPLPVCLQ